MTKQYKLEIPETIKKSDLVSAIDLRKFDGEIIISKDHMYLVDNMEICGGRQQIYPPESWLIPIEDKVLTADEYIATSEEYADIYYMRCKDFEAGEKNQWINHAELREAVAEWLDYYHGGMSKRFGVIETALKNIKPLT